MTFLISSFNEFRFCQSSYAELVPHCLIWLWPNFKSQIWNVFLLFAAYCPTNQSWNGENIAMACSYCYQHNEVYIYLLSLAKKFL